MKASARLVTVLALLALAVMALALFTPMETSAVDQPVAVVVDQAPVGEIAVVSITVPKTETPVLIAFDLIDATTDFDSIVVLAAGGNTSPPALVMAVENTRTRADYTLATRQTHQTARFQPDALPLVL